MRNGVVISVTPKSFSKTSTCGDYHGYPVSDGLFSSIQYYLGIVQSGQIVSKPLGGFTETYIYDNVPYQVTLTGEETTQLTVPGTAVSDTIARSNPSRPVVTPFTLIQDFIEIPAQLRNIGSLLTKPARILSAKELANQYLALQFGWLPLVQDVRALLNLQAQTLRRVHELKKLYDGVGLRRHLNILDDSLNRSSSTRLAVNANSWVDCAINISVKKRIWTSIHWKPTAPLPGVLQDEDMNRLAFRIVSGLTPEGLAKGAWDIIPWTWLLGWFTSVGNFMLLYNNTVPAQHSNICIMNELVADCVPQAVSPTNCASCTVAQGGAYRLTIRSRTISGGDTPGFNMPFMDVFKLSILGSLFVQRFVR